jgi:hypothetical protein
MAETLPDFEVMKEETMSELEGDSNMARDGTDSGRGKRGGVLTLVSPVTIGVFGSFVSEGRERREAGAQH